MPEIHPTADVHADARIADDASIGPYAVVSGDAVLAAGAVVEEHARVEGSVEIGPEARISFAARVGEPEPGAAGGGRTYVGARTVVREYSVVHGAPVGATTRLGEDVYVMACAVVGAGSTVGDRVVICNHVRVGAASEIGARAFLAGHAATAPGVRIGEVVMVGGKARLDQDVAPYLTVVDAPPRLAGLNVVGLRRAGFGAEERSELKRAYRHFFRRRAPAGAAEDGPGFRRLAEFVAATHRGVLGLTVGPDA